MIVTEVLGSIHEDPTLARAHHERVLLPVAALAKRIQRLTSDHGREFGLRLAPDAADLRDGDVLIAEPDNVVIVQVDTSDVIVIAPRTVGEALFAAHSLGNRHLPAQFFDASSVFGAEVMVCQYDHTVEQFLIDHAIPYRRETRAMEVPFRHAEHTH